MVPAQLPYSTPAPPLQKLRVEEPSTAENTGGPPKLSGPSLPCARTDSSSSSSSGRAAAAPGGHVGTSGGGTGPPKPGVAEGSPWKVEWHGGGGCWSWIHRTTGEVRLEPPSATGTGVGSEAAAVAPAAAGEVGVTADRGASSDSSSSPTSSEREQQDTMRIASAPASAAPAPVTRGGQPWSEQEDAALRDLVAREGVGSWAAKRLALGRSVRSPGSYS
jgi:hypothetical protein